MPALTLRANAQSRCAPARCAGARAERPARGRERTAIAWWQGQHDQEAHCWRATHDKEQREDVRERQRPHRRGDDKIALTRASARLLECARRISARKKLIHAMSLNADQLASRAKVVGCSISATCNYLKSHGPKTLNPLFCINRAKTFKLCRDLKPPLFGFPKSSTSYRSS